MTDPTKNVALQDENHRIISSDNQWMIQHRKKHGWMTDAFCITRLGVIRYLSCSAFQRGRYLPLHLWPVVPVLPSIHPLKGDA